MKKSVWLIIIAGILFCLSVGLTVLGVYRIIYIVKTDPFEDTVKYILKVFGLVGIIFLQIAGWHQRIYDYGLRQSCISLEIR